MELTTVSAAINGLRAAVDLVKGAVSQRDDRLIDKVIGDMNARLMDVQGQCLALQEKQFSLAESERQLKEKLSAMEKKSADFDQYELHHLPSGAVVQRRKGPVEGDAPQHQICANCAATGVKTFLQPKAAGAYLSCPTHGDIPARKPGDAESRARRVSQLP